MAAGTPSLSIPASGLVASALPAAAAAPNSAASIPSLLLSTSGCQAKLWKLTVDSASKKSLQTWSDSMLPSVQDSDGVSTALLSCWSHDNDFYALARDSGASVAVELWSGALDFRSSHSATDTSIHETRKLDEIPLPPTSPSSEGRRLCGMQFLAKSRFLLVADGRGGSVRAFDMRQRKWKLCHQLAPSMLPCSGMVVNADETTVAISGRDGSLALLPWPPTVLPSSSSPPTEPCFTFPAPISRLAFSQFRKSLLCCALEDGTVHLFHASTEPRILHTFTSHSQPVTGITFSPFNRFLMAIGGLDQRLVLYDVEKLVAVRTIQAEVPLQSLSFHMEGVVLAAGGVDGRIFMYDLSARGKHPVQVLEDAHPSGAVDSLRFMVPPRRSSGGPKTPAQPSTAVKSSMSNTQRPLTTISRPPAAAPATAPAAPSLRVHEKEESVPVAVDQSVNYMDMFSPVVNRTRKEVLPLPKRDRAPPTVEEAKYAAPVKAIPPRFGPLKAFDIQKKAKLAAEKEAAKEASAKEVPLAKMFSPLSSSLSSKKPQPSPETTPAEEMEMVELSPGSSSPKKKLKASVESPSPESLPSAAATVKTAPAESSRDGAGLVPSADSIAQSVNALRETINEKLAQVETAPPVHSAASADIPTSTHAPFNLSLLSSVIDDALDDFRNDLRRDVQNMHLELIRQFEWQRLQMEASMRQVLMEFCAPAHGGVLEWQQQMHLLEKQEEEERAFLETFLASDHAA